MNADKVLGFAESYSGMSDWPDVHDSDTLRAIAQLAASGRIEKHTRLSGVTVWHTTDGNFPRKP